MWLKLWMLSKCIIKWKRIVSRLIHSIKFHKKQKTQVYFSTYAGVLLVIASTICLSILKDQRPIFKGNKLSITFSECPYKLTKVVSNVSFGVWDRNVSPSTQCPCAKYCKAGVTNKMVHQEEKNSLFRIKILIKLGRKA